MKSLILALCLVGYVSCMQRTVWSSNFQETPISLDTYIDSQNKPNSQASVPSNQDPVGPSPQFPVRARIYPQFPIRHGPGASQHLTRILPPWLLRNPHTRTRIPVPDPMDEMPYFKGHFPGLPFPLSGRSMDNLALLSEYTQEMKRHNLDKSFFH